MGVIIMCHHHITIFTIFCFTIFYGFVSNDCACLPATHMVIVIYYKWSGHHLHQLSLPNLNFSNRDMG
uniref:Uncharacterized protein n=1 Tax=Gossypium raimondii TaxID=29730 RepID=A0A0D2R2I3_GOSRA|nr:hypothetical protein B456_004G228000 [Gossypium raimondii]